MEQYLNEDTLNNLITMATEFGLNILSAAMILFIGLWVAKRLEKWVGVSVSKAGVDITLCLFLAKLTHFAMAAFVIIAALSRVGIQTASFVAVLAAAGLAIGMALQGSLGNFAAGVLILLFRPGMT